MILLAAILVFTAGVHRVAAAGPLFALCMAGCTPLLINPLAAAACAAGCAALGVPEDGAEIEHSPRFLPDGSVVFEKESSLCAEACQPLIKDPIPYSACLAGCAAAERK